MDKREGLKKQMEAAKKRARQTKWRLRRERRERRKGDEPKAVLTFLAAG